MPKPPTNSRYRLVVEGTDDEHTVIHVMKAHAYDWDDASTERPFVQCAGSVEQAVDSISVGAKNYERFGLVVDADDCAGRWAQVRDRLRALGYGLGSDCTLPSGGLILQPPPSTTLARFGAWLMPDNEAPGTLEHFLVKMVPDADPCYAHAQSATMDARLNHNAPFAATDESKAIVHAWLAWQRPPGRPYGTAIAAGSFDTSALLPTAFAAWFKLLFAK